MQFKIDENLPDTLVTLFAAIVCASGIDGDASRRCRPTRLRLASERAA